MLSQKLIEQKTSEAKFCFICKEIVFSENWTNGKCYKHCGIVNGYKMTLYGKQTYNIKDDLKSNSYKFDGKNWYKIFNNFDDIMNDINSYKKYLNDITVNYILENITTK